VPDIRLGLVTRFLVTIMKNSPIDVMIGFIKQKMNTIWSLLDSSLNVDTENAFANRCGGYVMIEAFVASVPREKIEKDNLTFKDKITLGTKLIKDLFKKMKEVRRVEQELFRKFNCFCYRALAATITNTNWCL
jgi:NUC194 domain